MKDIQKVAEIFETLVKLILEKPDEMTMAVVPDGTGSIFRVTVARGDVGVLIGKEGRIARSLRIILLAISMKTKQKISLDIIGPK
jgi:predicted RNA-binding protein YlqC (UPF0109 family)